eukprot:RCo008908
MDTADSGDADNVPMTSIAGGWSSRSVLFAVTPLLLLLMLPLGTVATAVSTRLGWHHALLRRFRWGSSGRSPREDDPSWRNASLKNGNQSLFNGSTQGGNQSPFGGSNLTLHWGFRAGVPDFPRVVVDLAKPKTYPPDSCVLATHFFTTPVFMHSQQQGIHGQHLQRCEWPMFIGPCRDRFLKCLLKRMGSPPPSASNQTSLPPRNATLCFFQAGAVLYHDIYYIVYMLAARPHCGLYYLPSKFGYIRALLELLFSRHGVVIPPKHLPTGRFIGVVPAFQPTAVDFNFLYPGQALEEMRQEVFRGLSFDPFRRVGKPVRAMILQRKSRAMANTNAVAKVLSSQLGLEVFTTMTESSMPFSEQIRLWATADIVLTMHGSGLSSLVFLPPHGCVVEVFPPGFLNGLYIQMAMSRRLCYLPMVSHGTPRADAVSCMNDHGCCFVRKAQNGSLDEFGALAAGRYC